MPVEDPEAGAGILEFEDKTIVNARGGANETDLTESEATKLRREIFSDPTIQNPAQWFKKSKFKNHNYIFGNANSRNYLTGNYINVQLKNLKSKFRSTSNEYIEKLSKKLIEKKFDIIEIHNRPLILFKLLNKINSFSSPLL